MTTDQGNTGIAIIDRSGAYSWSTNPRSWTYLLLKPYDWGASVWEFIKTNEKTPTGIETIDNSQMTNDNSAIYNSQGQRVGAPSKGIYIQNGRKKVVK